MVIKRRARFSFTDEPTISRAICQSCYERGVTTFTVPYIMKNEHPDKGFRSCPYCLALTPIRLTRYNSETQPLGSNSIGKAQFEVLESSKRRRIRHKEDNEVFDVSQYPLAGKEDKDLRYFANQGIIVSVNDENVDSTEEEY